MSYRSELEEVAYHEAGHAVVAAMLGARVERVSIERGVCGTKGYIDYNRGGLGPIARLAVTMAGIFVEIRRYGGYDADTAHHDIESLDIDYRQLAAERDQAVGRLMGRLDPWIARRLAPDQRFARARLRRMGVNPRVTVGLSGFL